MINASLYKSHYKDGNGDWRSTEFDQRFNINSCGQGVYCEKKRIKETLLGGILILPM